MNTLELKALSVDALQDLLKATLDGTHAAIVRASHILVELESRGVRHPAMRDASALRWFREISPGRLSPKAALQLGGIQTLCVRLLDIPLEAQDKIADGEMIEVAEYDATGAIVETSKPLLQLSTAALDLAFDRGKIRPIREQVRILRSKQGDQAPTPSTYQRVRVDAKAGQLVFGNMRVSPDELIEPLLTLGFSLVRSQSSKRAA